MRYDLLRNAAHDHVPHSPASVRARDDEVRLELFAGMLHDAARHVRNWGGVYVRIDLHFRRKGTLRYFLQIGLRFRGICQMMLFVNLGRRVLLDDVQEHHVRT